MYKQRNFHDDEQGEADISIKELDGIVDIDHDEDDNDDNNDNADNSDELFGLHNDEIREIDGYGEIT